MGGKSDGVEISWGPGAGSGPGPQVPAGSRVRGGFFVVHLDYGPGPDQS